MLTSVSNSLTVLPEEIGDMKSLVKLSLGQNKLASIPPEIGKLQNVTNLDIAQNSLSFLPEGFGNLSGLEQLDIHDNNLDSLPSDFGKLASLNILYLNNNNLAGLPGSITNVRPERDCDFALNSLDKSNLSDTLITWLDMYDPDWYTTQTTEISNSNEASSLNSFSLEFNYKNPSIISSMPTSGNVQLHLYDSRGRVIATLLDSYKFAGRYTVRWNWGINGAGVYFLKLSANNDSVIRKVIINK